MELSLTDMREIFEENQFIFGVLSFRCLSDI